jgi:hypothetical protein
LVVLKRNDSIDDETDCDGDCVESEKTLRRMIIAGMEQTLLSVVFIGKDKMKWGNVKIKQMAKYFEKITWCYSPSQESH